LATSALYWATSKDTPGTVRYVFADQAALMVAMGKHDTEDRKEYRAQVWDLEAGAAPFVNFALVALKEHLEER
jgi:hypothetical protein